MASKRQDLQPHELEVVARDYVRRRMYEPGGLREAWGGLCHKTGPRLLGVDGSLRFSSLLALLLRLTLFLAAICFPILTRKLWFSSAAHEPISDGWTALTVVLARLDGLDGILALVAIVIFGLPKVMELVANAGARAEFRFPYSDFAAAIEKTPFVVAEEQVEESLRFALSALRSEMAELVADSGHRKLTDVTLLQFCGPGASQMEVRARTANEPVRRPRDARLFLANYVARQGRWFIEHDFLRADNPFPPVRLTVTGAPPVGYRSVLYIPVLSSRRESLTMPGQQHGAPEPVVVDECIGVICVHSQKAFRFWRWGDHKRRTGGFGDVAFERSLPYIALITLLIERSAQRVQVVAA